MTTRTRLLLLIAIAVVAAVAAIGWARGRSVTPSPTGSATPSEAVVTRGDLDAQVSATGTVTAARSARLGFPSSGRITDLFVAAGDEVAAGAPLMRVETTQLDLRLESAQAQADAARAALEEARNPTATADIQAAQARVEAAQLALSIAEAERDALPEATRGESEEAVRAEEARAALTAAEAQLRRLVEGSTPAEIATLEARLRSAEGDLKEAQEALAQSTMRAPYAATVVTLDAQPGEIVGTGQRIVTIADMGTLEISAEVDEVDVGRVEAGQGVTVTLDAFPTQPLAGELIRIAPGSSGTRGATSYRATVRFDPQGLPIRLDMGADLQIRTADVRDALLLPLDAIRYAEAQPFVTVWRDGRWQDQPVTLGAQNESSVAILDGVSEGERVQR